MLKIDDVRAVECEIHEMNSILTHYSVDRNSSFVNSKTRKILSLARTEKFKGELIKIDVDAVN